MGIFAEMVMLMGKCGSLLVWIFYPLKSDIQPGVWHIPMRIRKINNCRYQDREEKNYITALNVNTSFLEEQGGVLGGTIL